jgi:hypothetical protein
MNVIRHLVSGDKYRVKDGEIDLDLTYITPKIIAMVHKLYSKMSVIFFYACVGYSWERYQHLVAKSY